MKNYFKESEFNGWHDKMSPLLLHKLNQFREAWGDKVVISSASGAIGRHEGSSQHNFDKWKEVRAIDIFPEGMKTSQDMKRAYDIALSLGFTGIGLYTDTSRPMMHLDVREDRSAGSPAKWSRVAGVYGSITDVMA